MAQPLLKSKPNNRNWKPIIQTLDCLGATGESRWFILTYACQLVSSCWLRLLNISRPRKSRVNVRNCHRGVVQPFPPLVPYHPLHFLYFFLCRAIPQPKCPHLLLPLFEAFLQHVNFLKNLQSQIFWTLLPYVWYGSVFVDTVVLFPKDSNDLAIGNKLDLLV